MVNGTDIAFEQRLARYSGRIGLAVAIAGLLVLAGWALDISALK